MGGTKNNMISFSGNGEGGAQVTSIPVCERASMRVLTGPDVRMAQGPTELCRVGDKLFSPRWFSRGFLKPG